MKTRRILIRGNCHAQFLGAALKALTKHEVRVAGLPYDGPIHFGGAMADYTDLTQGLDWIREADERPIFIVQATPGKHYLSEKWLAMGVDHELVKMPFIRLGAFELNNLPDTEDAARKIRLEVRKDRIFNEMSAVAAGRDAKDIDYVLEAFQSSPEFYSHSHYTGKVFARLFSLMRGSALDKALGEGGFDAFLDSVSRDAGVGHLMRPLPDPRVMQSMGMTWTTADLSADVIAADHKMKTERANPESGVVAFALFDHAFKAYRDTRSVSDILTCVRLYKAKKFYLRWANNIVGALISRGKLMHAAVILFHRLAFDDSRGMTLRIALPHLYGLSASAAARRVADRYAEAYPNSSAVFAREIMQKFR